MVLRLIVAATALACATGWSVNPPPVTRTQAVVIVIDDDRSVADLSIFTGADYPGAGGADYITGASWQPTTPELDGLSGQGVRVPFFNAQPQCNISQAVLYTGRLPPEIGAANFAGGVSSREPTLCRELKRHQPDAVCFHIGKSAASVPFAGFCSEDGVTECRVDSECSGSCLDVPNFALLGWDEARGPANFNSPAVNWAKRTITWGGSGTQIVESDDGTIATYRDEVALADFASLWGAYKRRQGIWVVAPGNPHAPFHEAPSGSACMSGDEACFEAMLGYVTETVLAGIVDAIGEDMATTCVVYLSDNGRATPDLAGGKFGIQQGGSQVGALWMGSCVGAGQAGVMLSRGADLTDLHRAALAMLGAWGPEATLPNLPNSSRLRGQPLVMHGEDILAAVSGYCAGAECGSGAGARGSYVLSRLATPGMDSVSRAISDDSGYKLIATYDGAYGSAPWHLYLLPDESTDLYDGALTSEQSVAFAALRAKLDMAESSYPSELVALSWTHAGGAVVGSPTTFRLRLTAATDIDEMPLPTTVVCDIDFGEGDPQRLAYNFVPLIDYGSETISDATVWHDFEATYTTPGAKNVAGECWDVFTRTSPLAVAEVVNVSTP